MNISLKYLDAEQQEEIDGAMPIDIWVGEEAEVMQETRTWKWRRTFACLGSPKSKKGPLSWEMPISLKKPGKF